MTLPDTAEYWWDVRGHSACYQRKDRPAKPELVCSNCGAMRSRHARVRLPDGGRLRVGSYPKLGCPGFQGGLVAGMTPDHIRALAQGKD